MRLILDLINAYAKEQGFEKYGYRYVSKYFYFDVVVRIRHVIVTINGKKGTCYLLGNVTDGVHFCQVLESMRTVRSIGEIVN